MNFASLNRAFMDCVRARMTSVSAFSVFTYLVSVCKVCAIKVCAHVNEKVCECKSVCGNRVM